MLPFKREIRGDIAEVDRLRKRVVELERSLARYEEAAGSAETGGEYSGFYESVPELIQILAPDGRILYVNRGWRETFGFSLEEIKKTFFTDVLRKDQIPKWREIFQRLVHQEQNLSCDFILKTKPGKSIRLHACLTPVMRAGRLIRINITYPKDTSMVKGLWEKESFFLSSLDLLFIVGFDGRLKRVNPAFEKVLGYCAGELLERPLLDLVHSEDRPAARKQFKQLRSGVPSLSFESRYIAKDGSCRWLAWTSHSLAAEDKIFAVARDITEKKELEEELRRLSFSDELTKLYNRRGFMTFTEKMLKISYREKKGVLVVILDVNGLKEINDTFGHLEGDSALAGVAGILKEVFRESDILARIGGDEFAVSALVQNERSCRRIKSRLQKLAKKFNQEAGRPYQLSFSIGCSCSKSQERPQLDLLMAAADEALYADKRRCHGEPAAASRL